MGEDAMKISLQNEKNYNLELNMGSTQILKAVRNIPKNSCEL